MAEGQLAGIMTLGTEQAQAAHVKIMFTREVTVELVRRLKCPRAVTDTALRVHIDPSDAPGGCLLTSVTADVRARGCCGVVQWRAGFGVIIGRNLNVGYLIEVFHRTDPRSTVAGRADSADEIQGVVHPMVARDVGEGASRRWASVAGGAILSGQGRSGTMTASAGRADPADAVQIGAVAEGAGNGQIGRVAMGYGTSPGNGIGR